MAVVSQSVPGIKQLLGPPSGSWASNKGIEITVDMEGRDFWGLTLVWNYQEHNANISKSGYVAKKLKKYQHPIPQKPQYAPHKWLKPTYRKRIQHAPPPDTTDKLDKNGTKRIQSICGSFLYYARAADPTILPALNDIAVQQAAPTLDTNKKYKC